MPLDHSAAEPHDTKGLAQRSWLGHVRLGVRAGMAVAILFSAVAGIFYMLNGREPFDELHVTLFRLILSYFAGGIVIGAVAGALHVLSRWTPGVIAVGALCGVLALFTFQMARSGLPFSKNDDGVPVLFLAGAFAFAGAITAVCLRREVARRKKQRGI